MMGTCITMKHSIDNFTTMDCCMLDKDKGVVPEKFSLLIFRRQKEYERCSYQTPSDV